jgi:hypothetical protein
MSQCPNSKQVFREAKGDGATVGGEARDGDIEELGLSR